MFSTDARKCDRFRVWTHLIQRHTFLIRIRKDNTLWPNYNDGCILLWFEGKSHVFLTGLISARDRNLKLSCEDTKQNEFQNCNISFKGGCNLRVLMGFIDNSLLNHCRQQQAKSHGANQSLNRFPIKAVADRQTDRQWKIGPSSAYAVFMLGHSARQ